jgi:hypothetical protein
LRIPYNTFCPHPIPNWLYSLFSEKKFNFSSQESFFAAFVRKRLPRLLERVFALVVFQRLQQLALVFCGPSFAKHILASVEIRFMKKKTITNHI